MTGRRRPAAHGTRSKYSRGCRCAPCTSANSEYLTAWRRARGVKPQRYGITPRPPRAPRPRLDLPKVR